MQRIPINEERVSAVFPVKIAMCFLITIIGYTFTPIHYLPVVSSLSIYFFIGWATSLVVVKDYFSTNQFRCFILYLIIVALNYWMGDNYFSTFDSVLEQATIIPIPMIITYYVLTHNDRKLGKQILAIFSIILLYTTIVSYRIDSQMPGIIRYGLDEKFIEGGAMSYFYSIGLSNYQFPHALPFIIPAIVVAIKEIRKSKIRLVFIMLLLSCLVLTYISSSTGALILAIFSLIASLIVNTSTVRKNIRRIALVSVIILPFAYSLQLQLGVLKMIGTVVNNESLYQEKIAELISVASGTTDSSNDITIRGELRQKTLESFLESPIWGTNKNVGHHNMLLDCLAVLGVIGFIPLMMLLIYHIRFVRQYVAPNYQTYYLIGSATFLLMMFTKSVSCWDVWFVFATVLPISMWLLSVKKIITNK